MPTDHPLHKIAARGDIDQFNDNYELDPVDINIEGSQGRTFLHRACAGKHDSMTRLLLEKYKANPNSRDSKGCSPLFHAALQGAVGCAKILLEFGADLQLESNNGQTALHYSAMKGEADFTAFLIERNIDTAKVDKAGKTAYDLAFKQYKRSKDERVLFKKNMQLLKGKRSCGPSLVLCE
eukprot:maker-scaffold_1-snap-gene-27.50-mRNA-1 protein AED:0.34 eAED:0.34 QI:242/1/1/1/1/1/2/157/179